MKRPPLSRRTVLRGLGGAAIALPFLDAMRTKDVHAATTPKRFIGCFSANGNFPQGTGEGSDFELAPHLAPLALHQSDLILLEGFNNQVASKSPGDNHQRGIGCMLTGAKLSEEPIFCEALCEDGSKSYVGWANGISLDQHLARAPGIGDQTKLPSLELGVGVQLGTVYARMCYSGPGQPIAPEDDPLKVFGRLFGNASPELRAKRKSILDAVASDYAALDGRLGKEDQARLDAHLTAVRKLEKDLDAPAFQPGGVCRVPTLDRPADIYGDASYPAVGKAQIDLLVMALACDLTRVVTLQWDTSVSNVFFSWLPGVVESHHDLSHHPDDDLAARAQLELINQWYASQFAYLLSSLSAIPDGNGTLLDQCAVLWSNELSKGYSHTLYDMHWILAGSCAGAFETGRLLRYKGDPHNGLLVSIANAMGSPIETFGDPEFCTGPMPQLAG